VLSISTTILWVISTIVYLGTMIWSDAGVDDAAPPPPLVDVGFSIIPRIDAMVFFSDGVGISLAAVAVYLLFWGSTSRLRDAARRSVFCVSHHKRHTAQIVGGWAG